MKPNLTPTQKALLRGAYLKHFADLVKTAEKENKADLDALMAKGDTLAVRSPLDDTKIARISKSDPDPKGKISDAEAVARWVEENYPDKMTDEWTIVGTNAEVVKVLREHAPHLLARQRVVPAWVLNELEVMAGASGEPVGFSGETDEQAPPGIEVVVPDGVLSVTLDKVKAPDALRSLWEAHLFAMNGTVRELSAATETA